MKLNRFNRLFWPLLIFPLCGLLYYPVNRYIMLPAFGDGAAYTDLSGTLVDHYFSANQMAVIVCVLLAAATVVFGVRTVLRYCPKKLRIPAIVFFVLFAVVEAVCFLEFSLWS